MPAPAPDQSTSATRVGVVATTPAAPMRMGREYITPAGVRTRTWAAVPEEATTVPEALLICGKRIEPLKAVPGAAAGSGS